MLGGDTLGARRDASEKVAHVAIPSSETAYGCAVLREASSDRLQPLQINGALYPSSYDSACSPAEKAKGTMQRGQGRLLSKKMVTSFGVGSWDWFGSHQAKSRGSSLRGPNVHF